jgi:hypothetical protein
MVSANQQPAAAERQFALPPDGTGPCFITNSRKTYTLLMADQHILQREMLQAARSASANAVTCIARDRNLPVNSMGANHRQFDIIFWTVQEHGQRALAQRAPLRRVPRRPRQALCSHHL